MAIIPKLHIDKAPSILQPFNHPIHFLLSKITLAKNALWLPRVSPTIICGQKCLVTAKHFSSQYP
jgi:hypothetical protein